MSKISGALRNQFKKDEEMQQEKSDEMVKNGCLSLGDARYHLQITQYLTNLTLQYFRVCKCNPIYFKEQQWTRATQWKGRQVLYNNLDTIIKYAIESNKAEAKKDIVTAIQWINRHSGYFYYIKEDIDGSIILSEDYQFLFKIKGIAKNLSQIFAPDLNNYPVKFYTTILPLDHQLTYDLMIEVPNSELYLTNEEKMNRKDLILKKIPSMKVITKLNKTNVRYETTLYDDYYLFDDHKKEGILKVITKEQLSNKDWYVDKLSDLDYDEEKVKEIDGKLVAANQKTSHQKKKKKEINQTIMVMIKKKKKKDHHNDNDDQKIK